MRGCGRIERPAFPAPSDFQTRKSNRQNSGTRREIAEVCVQLSSTVIARSESDEAIHLRSCDAEPWIASLAHAMTACSAEVSARDTGPREHPDIAPTPASASLRPTLPTKGGGRRRSDLSAPAWRDRGGVCGG